jgi:hypothetical protein
MKTMPQTLRQEKEYLRHIPVRRSPRPLVRSYRLCESMMMSGHIPGPTRDAHNTMRKKRAGEPSVPVQGIVTSKPVVVCHKAALFLIGISARRVQRVLEGQTDGRKKGLRLPNDSLTSGPMSVCLRFLWRSYHFDADGLPDKFSIERHDMTSMTIGAQCHPNRTTIPARSALHPLGEAGPNQAEVLEEEERAIASIALYIGQAGTKSTWWSCPVHWGHECPPPVVGIRGLVQHPQISRSLPSIHFCVP